jgi:electron transfer flavoprotein-quinone oxidoreductase
MMPKLVTSGMVVAGDAAGFCLATGLYIEGINYAMQSGQAAGQAAAEACRLRDFSSRTLQYYTELLWPYNVFTDFRRYRHAPAFVNGERLQNLYPDMVADSIEQLFKVDGTPKQKIIPLYFRTMRKFKVKPRHLVQDLFQVARSYLW